jgi:hypothetical protein
MPLLQISSTGYGYTIPNLGNHTIDAGVSFEVRAIPFSGSHYVKMTVGGVVHTENPVTITMPNTKLWVLVEFQEDVEEATWIRMYPPQGSGGGSTQPPVGNYKYTDVRYVTITATPDANSLWDKWVIDERTEERSSLPLLTDRDHMVTPYFTAKPTPPPPNKTWNLGIQPNFGPGAGSTNPAPGNYRHIAGTVVRVSATPDAGSLWGHWFYDGTEDRVDNPFNVLMDRDHTIAPYFLLAAPPPPPPPPVATGLEWLGVGVTTALITAALIARWLEWI